MGILERISTLVETLLGKAALGATPEGLLTEFESGVLSMISAREVRLRNEPAATPAGLESVYFTVPGSESGVLQVTFDSGYRPTPEEFEALKAAAAAAGTLQPAITGPRELHSTAAAASARVSGSQPLVPAARASARESHHCRLRLLLSTARESHPIA